MNRTWQWEDAQSEWGVTLDEPAGVLRWWGADKPRPGVPAHALSGGGVDQPMDDLVRTRRAPYACPAPILDEIIRVVTAKRVVRVPVDRPLPAGADEVLRLVAEMFATVCGRALGPERLVRRTEVRTIEDDLPRQTSGESTTTELLLGGILDVTLVDTWEPWRGRTFDIRVQDLGGHGPLHVAFTDGRCTVEGAPAVVEPACGVLRGDHPRGR